MHIHIRNYTLKYLHTFDCREIEYQILFGKKSIFFNTNHDSSIKSTKSHSIEIKSNRTKKEEMNGTKKYGRKFKNGETS